MSNTTVSPAKPALPPALLEQVLARLGFNHRPEPTLEDLRAIYSSWGQRVSFDNVRKIIHVRGGNNGPLPGTTAEDYFNAWLRFGTGGTCWSGAGALHALLTSLGFNAARGIATMLVVPDVPPNHGTVMVTLDDRRYLVDSSILHGEPLEQKTDAESGVNHPAWGIRSYWKNGQWHVAWRPLHKVDGFECRFERFGATAADYAGLYDKTRDWSPFNYEVTARKNRNNNTVVGLAFGHAVTLSADGSVKKAPISQSERNRLLIEEAGISEEIVTQLPEDVPTPPPPWSRTAQSGS